MMGKVSLVLAATLAFGGTAGAATLTTNTLQSSTDQFSQGVLCEAVNVGNKPIEVTFEYVNVGGTVIDTMTTQVDPAEAESFEHLSGFLGFTVYCRITFKGGKRKIVGAMRLRDSNFNTISVAPAR